MGLQMKLKSANFNLNIMDRASDRILCVGLLRRFGFALNTGLPFGHVPLWGHKRKDVRTTVARTSRAAISRTSRAAISRTSRVPHHEHLALRWHALSRYGGTTHISRITASRTSRATAARTLSRTLTLQYQGSPHLAYRITNIPRYGGTHSRTAISRMSALWKHKCSGNCREPSKILYARQLAGQL